MFSKRDYQNAYYADTAVNLSGLAHSLVEVCRKIREDAEAEGRCASSREVNEHPLVKHYAYAMFHLSNAFDYEAMSDARDVIKERGECYPFVVQV